MSTANVLIYSSANHAFGFDIAAAGDANGDGYNDILVGAPMNLVAGYSGAAYLFFGGAFASHMSKHASSADAKFSGEYQDDSFGYSVTGVEEPGE